MVTSQLQSAGFVHLVDRRHVRRHVYTKTPPPPPTQAGRSCFFSAVSVPHRQRSAKIGQSRFQIGKDRQRLVSLGSTSAKIGKDWSISVPHRKDWQRLVSLGPTSAKIGKGQDSKRSRQILIPGLGCSKIWKEIEKVPKDALRSGSFRNFGKDLSEQSKALAHDKDRDIVGRDRDRDRQRQRLHLRSLLLYREDIVASSKERSQINLAICG